MVAMGELRRYRASSSYLPHTLSGQGQIVLRRHCASSDYSLGTNMVLPTLMLRRYCDSNSCFPNCKDGERMIGFNFDLAHELLLTNA